MSTSLHEKPVTLFEALARGIRCRCPRCGRGTLYEGGYRLRSHCVMCGLPLQRREPDTYFLMYMSTAAITGIFIIAMFLTSPRSLWQGRVVVTVLALLVMFGTLPFRKGLAIGWDFYIETKTTGS